MALQLLKRNWLITSFEPFAGRPSNHSDVILNEIKKIVSDPQIKSEIPISFHFAILPVEYDGCFPRLCEEIEKLKQNGIALEGVLSLGEGAEEFKLETQANNLDDVPGFPDNKGVVRADQKIFKDLPKDAALPLRFPFEAFAKIRSSKNPGNYICNHLCAEMSRHFSDPKSSPYFGFIHVPREGMGGMFTADICATIIVNGFRKLN